MAAEVAAPIPRLAPVTIATRPASQCPGSPADWRPGIRPDDSPVELLVSIQAPFQVEVLFGMVAAGRARYLGCPSDAVRGRLDVVGRDQEAGLAIHDNLAKSAPLERDDRSPARLGISGGHAKGLVPPGRAEN